MSVVVHTGNSIAIIAVRISSLSNQIVRAGISVIITVIVVMIHGELGRWRRGKRATVGGCLRVVYHQIRVVVGVRLRRIRVLAVVVVVVESIGHFKRLRVVAVLLLRRGGRSGQR